MKKLSLFFFFIPLLVFAFKDSTVKTPSEQALYNQIEKLKKDADLRNASWGICIASITTGKYVAQYNSDVSLIPASTLKIFTTGAALGLLDTNYKYETRLEYDGYIDTLTGILHGDVYLKGGGDPTLESEYFKSRNGIIDKWVEAIKQSGIKKVEGNIVADARVFDDEPLPSSWIWGDIGNYYGAGACGLSFKDNKYTLFFKSGKYANDTTSITKIIPEFGLQVTNKVKTGGNDDNAFIYGAPYSYTREVRGTIPLGKTNYEVEGSVPDPAYYCAYLFGKKLIEQIEFSGEIKTSRNYKINDKRILLYTSYSPTLDSIVYYTNLKSNNLYAEHLLKTLAYKKSGIGMEDKGVEQIKQYWESKGVQLNGLYMSDGCGLSRMNSITVRQQVDVLKIIAQEPYYRSFYNSLPVAGKSGSLSSMCKNTRAENNLRAKSGYINKVRGYAGYVTAKSGEQLAFSVLANNYNCSPAEMRKKIERLLVLIAELE